MDARIAALMAPLTAPLMARAVPWLLAAIVTGCACPGGVELRVESSGGDPKASFCATIARSEAARMQGLRGHAPLAPGEGLLLAFSIEDELCIVNDGVTFPIDVLYANAAGTVIALEPDFPAGDGSPRCHGPAQFVLEVAAGGLSGVREGDGVVGLPAIP